MGADFAHAHGTALRHSAQPARRNARTQLANITKGILIEHVHVVIEGTPELPVQRIFERAAQWLLAQPSQRPRMLEQRQLVRPQLRLAKAKKKQVCREQRSE